MITNIRESDHGSYQCRAENEVESLDAVAELIVQGNICGVHYRSCAISYVTVTKRDISFVYSHPSSAEIYKKTGG